MVKQGAYLLPLTFVFVLMFALAACSATAKPTPQAKKQTQPQTHSHDSTEQVFALPKPKSKQLTQAFELWATYYRIHQTQTAKTGIPLLGANNQKLGPILKAADWCESALEGTALIARGDKQQIYNYRDHRGPSQVDCTPFFPRMKRTLLRAMEKTRFMEAKATYGYGVREWHLNPYRTIATDPRLIPHGSVLYIPQARGSKIYLSNGKQVTHDGYFYAGDRGGAIKENHIDVFSGLYQDNPFPHFIKNSKAKTFQAYLVEDEMVVSFLTQLHQKGE